MAVDAQKTPIATFEVVEALTEEEAKARHRLELKVERAFSEAGYALRELRDRRLYRSTHRTFEAYCKDRFGYNRSRSYQMIDAAMVVDNLKECPQFVDKLPKSEFQCRPLTKLTPEQQRQAWTALLEDTGSSSPTGKEVKSIVERLREKHMPPATDAYKIGDVFWLIGLSGSERKYNGCWARAIAVNDFTVVIDVHDGTLTMKTDSLKPIDEPDVRRQLLTILKRIRRLRNCELLNRCAYTVLDSLGRQTYLSEVEEKVLCCLEAHYSVRNAEN